jgi:predicted nucleic acid-binding protein
VRFWDSSCIVPLVVEEKRSRACRDLFRRDRKIAVWSFTPVEVVAALRRVEREGGIGQGTVTRALSRLEAHRSLWTEIAASDSLIERALRILALHPLKSGDALQLAAALELVSDRPRRHAFVTADLRLAEAATRTGFVVTVPRG